MSEILWPAGITVQPARLSLRLIAPSLAHTSPLSGVSQTVYLPGARWGAEVEWPPVTAWQSTQIESLRARLRLGAVLRMWHLSRQSLRGVGGGSPVVAAGSSGPTLHLSGLPASVVGWAQPGDLLGVAGGLHMVTLRVDSAADGTATVSVAPPMRRVPATGAAVVTVRPSTLWRLSDQQPVEWTHEAGGVVTAHTMSLVEEA